MRPDFRIILFFLNAIFILLRLDNVYGQVSGLETYQYYSPLPNSIGINPETSIVIRYGKPIDAKSLVSDCLKIRGAISGMHHGEYTLSKDLLTIIFKPDYCFLPGEKVFLQLNEGIRTKEGNKLPGFEYGFTIRTKLSENLIYSSYDEINLKHKNNESINGRLSRKGNSILFNEIPEPFIYYSSGASPGNIMTVLEQQSDNYLYLFNNTGTLLFVRKTPHRISNFKPHFSGVATYFDHVIKGYIEIDPFLNIVDTLFMKDGYKADAHDILLLNNGHIIMESYDPQLVDMSKIAEGGDPNATVIGLVIQELDEDRNLFFEWRSWDHFKITDSYNNLLSSVVEYVHGNSLDADTDSTLIFSSRNLNEITKINRKTGEIIWRLGGKNNEFVFHNDTRGFSAQHSVMRQKNGNLTIFDNGNGFEPIYSRGIEYKVDEIYKTVTLVKEFRHEPDVFAYVTGNVQRLDNGNTFIFWGSIVGQSGHIISEYDSSGALTFEVRFDPFIYPTYASYRTGWDHNIFGLSADTLNFPQVIKGDSVSQSLNILNYTNSSINITSVYGHNLGFKINDLPIVIPALSSKLVSLEFAPKSMGPVSDVLTICQETDSLIVARQLVVRGKSIAQTGIHDEEIADFEIYPNPVINKLQIKSSKIIRNVSVYDLNGHLIIRTNSYGDSLTIDMESVGQGFYILEVIFSDKTRSIKRFIKQ